MGGEPSGGSTVLGVTDPSPTPDPAPAPDATPPDPATPPADPAPAPDPAPTPDPDPTPAPEPDPKDDPSKPTVPDTYDLTLPEGSRMSETAVEGISSLAKELGLTNDQAQQLMQARSDSIESYRTEERTRWDEITTGWEAELATIPEIGGEEGADLEANLTLARRAMAEFGNDELLEGLENSGYGNWPPLLRMLVKLGKGLEEDGVGGIKARSDSGPRTLAQKLHPDLPSEPL